MARVTKVLGLGAALLLAFAVPLASSSDRGQTVRAFLPKITWTGQAGIRIKSGLVIQIDPYKAAKPEKADLILITHSHQDHYSVDDINKIKKDGTILIVPRELEKCGHTVDVRAIEPGQALEVKGIKIAAVPAYNTNKPHHPEASKWLGYVLEIDGITIYHAGDTDIIPVMKDLAGVDIALLPVGGTYTMDPAEAAEAAGIIRAKATIPIHNLAPEKLDKFKTLYPAAEVLRVQG